MPDLELGENLQPILNNKNDYETVDGREEFEQWVRLNAIDRLYGIVDEYNRRDIPHKIRLELTRMVRESDFLDSVEEIEVKAANRDRSGYKVNVIYSESDDFSILLEDI